MCGLHTTSFWLVLAEDGRGNVSISKSLSTYLKITGTLNASYFETRERGMFFFQIKH